MIAALQAWMGKLFSPTTWIGVAALLGCVVLYFVFAVNPQKAEDTGVRLGQAECTTAAASSAVTRTAAAAASTAAKASADIDRSGKAGALQERARARIDSHFDHLEQEARHDAPNPVDACVLEPDRLRRWASANAGPGSDRYSADQSATARQFNTAPTDLAPATVGRDGRSGGQPPPSSQGVSSTGSAALQPADVSGDRAP